MSSFLEKCEEYFGSNDFYEILKVKRTATDKEIKKAYHKISLLVHPDRVTEDEKLEATEKFKVLGKIHSVLQDEEKRKVYDECGEFDDEDSDSILSWMKYWRGMFKTITKEDIKNYESDYIGSEKELRDIKKAYVSSHGDMDTIFEMVAFANCDSEPRILEIVRKMVDDGEVEEYDWFFNEPKRKRDNRRRKLAREAKEVEEMDEDFLEQMEKNREKRQSAFIGLLASIEQKYGKKGEKRKCLTDKGKSPKKRAARSKK